MKHTIALIILIISFSNLNSFSGKGSGTSSAPYQITTLEQLQEINSDAEHLAAHYILMNDIDASPSRNWNIGDHDNDPATPDSAMGFVPIGRKQAGFSGRLDGQGYVIEGLYINRPVEDSVGVFTVFSGSSTIKHIGIDSCEITGSDRVGVLAASNYGKIDSSFTKGEISGKSYVGGFVYYNKGKISSSYSDVTIKSVTYAGGFLSFNNIDGIISFCFAEGDVFADDDKYTGGFISNNQGSIYNSGASGDVTVKGFDAFIGGFAGNNSNTGTILNVYAKGNLKDGAGLVGSNSGIIYNSYSSGKIEDSYNGFIASNIGKVLGSFWDIETSGITRSEAGTGLTTEEMKNLDTYINAGWNFDFIWELDGDYPTISRNSEFMPLDTDSDGYIEISSLNDLRWLSETVENMDCNWELTENIDASASSEWNSGAGFIPIPYYKSKFNGNGYAIKNLHIDSDFKNNVGLFRQLYDDTCQIENLRLENIYLRGKYYVGSIAGKNNGAKISNIYVSGTFFGRQYVGAIIGKNFSYYIMTNLYAEGSMEIDNPTYHYENNSMGGIIGQNIATEIRNSHANVNINSQESAGGLIGYNSGGTIYNCYATGMISGGFLTGGLLGCDYNGYISHSYATGNISSGTSVGGLIGRSYASSCESVYATGYVSGKTNIGGLIGYNKSNINKAYALGNVSADWQAGGLIGCNEGGIISNCFARGNVTGNIYIGGFIGHNSNDTTSNSYSTGEIIADSICGGFKGLDNTYFETYLCQTYNSFWDIQTSKIDSSAGGSGLPTTDMKMKSTFTDATWDFDSIWAISPDINDGYPYLQDMEFVVSVKDNPGQAPLTGINVYPNPADEYIVLGLNGSPARAFEIRNLEGRLIKDGGLSGAGSTARIYIGEISAGYYFLRVVCSDKILSYPLLVE